MRSLLPGRSLQVRWKLTQEDNFRLNVKNTMINKQSNQRKRSASTQSFFEPSSTPRRGKGFFSADQKGEEASYIYLHLYDGDYLTNSTLVM